MKSFDDYRQQSSQLDFIIEAFDTKAPLFKNVFIDRYNEFGEKWLNEFISELKMLPDNLEFFKEIAKGYGSFCVEALRLQRDFDKSGLYPENSYDNALKTVYQNEKYMLNVYLPSLFLTHFLWSHHYKLQIWVKKQFFSKIDSTKESKFFDVGIGTGFYSYKFLKNFNNLFGYGYDISSASNAYTKNILSKNKLMNRYSLENKFVKFAPKDTFDYLICIELLEHLENPLQLLIDMHEKLKMNGLGIISAAINAPNRDHIYLYKSMAEVRNQIIKSGFKIQNEIELLAYEKIQERTVPSSGVFIVSKI